MAEPTEKKVETPSKPAQKDEEKQIKLLFIILDKWVPALITAGIGGFVVALVVPWIQSDYAKQSAQMSRKTQLWESIGTNFTNFINANFQLVSAAKSIKEDESNHIAPSNTALLRKEEYRQARDASASKLNADLVVASFYFNASTSNLIKNYRDWIVPVSTATINTMPSRTEFENWRNKILSNIGKQIIDEK